jgi:hypothetical protein
MHWAAGESDPGIGGLFELGFEPEVPRDWPRWQIAVDWPQALPVAQLEAGLIDVGRLPLHRIDLLILHGNGRGWWRFAAPADWAPAGIPNLFTAGAPVPDP